MDCYNLFADKIQRFRVGNNGQSSGLCPFHDDKRPSFSVNLDKGLWNCKGCGKKGNAYQFAKLLGIDPAPYKSYKTSKNSYMQSDIENEAKLHYEYLTTNFNDLQTKDKIPKCWELQAVEKTFTGYDKAKDCIVFNHCNLSGQPINIQWHKYGKEKKTIQKGQSECKLYPLNCIPDYDNNSFIVYVEGCPDVNALLSQRINAVSSTTGAGSIPKDLTPLKDFQQIYIVYDNDSAGIKGCQSLANKLKYEFPSMDIRIHFWKDQPSGYDITDYFQEGNSVNDFYMLLLNSEHYKISSENWLKLYRKSIESEVFKIDSLWRLWSYCLLKVSHKKQYVTWKTGRGSITMLLEPGQLVFGRNQLAKKLDIKPSTLYDRLKRLREMGNIEIQPNNQYSIITICNYKRYQ